jgi:hypothetical protein
LELIRFFRSKVEIPSETRNTMAENPWAAGWNKFVSGVQKGIQEKQDEIKAHKEAKESGKIWYPETKEWKFYYIEEELKELEAKATKLGGTATPSGSTVGTEEGRKVKDRTYYDLLECSTNADANQVSQNVTWLAS